MKTIQIEVPDGMIDHQEKKNGGLVITFKHKPKGSVLDRIKTFEDAFNEVDEETKQEFLKSVQGYDSPDDLARKKLKLIIKVINEGVLNSIITIPIKRNGSRFSRLPGPGSFSRIRITSAFTRLRSSAFAFAFQQSRRATMLQSSSLIYITIS